MPSTGDFAFVIAVMKSLYYAFFHCSLLRFIYDILFLSILFHYLTPREPGRRIPPGPTGIPIFGNMPWFIFTDPNKYLNKLYKKYGKIITIQMGTVHNYFISDYEMIMEMSNHPDFQRRPAKGLFGEINKDRGITDAEGNVWKHQRCFVLQRLKDVGIGKLKLENKIQDEIIRLCHAVEKSNGVPIDLNSMLKSATSNIIFNLAFNKSYEYHDPKFLGILKDLDEGFNASGKVQIVMFFPWLVKFFSVMINMVKKYPFFSGMIKMVSNNNKVIMKYQSEEFIKEHLQDFDPENPRDFLDLYLNEMFKDVTEENEEALKTFNIEQLQYVIGDLFASGTETSSTTICWALLFMIHHPKIQEKVQAEIDEVIGKERLPTMEDKRLLPFTTATLQEIERLACVVPATIPRSNDKPAHFRGYTFPEGSIFLFDIYSVHRDPTYWNNPLDFDPNRFIDKDSKVFRPRHLIPFGSGKRVCVGEAMAKMEIFLTFVTLLQRFTFKNGGNDLPNLDTRARSLVRSPISHKLRAISRSK